MTIPAAVDFVSLKRKMNNLYIRVAAKCNLKASNVAYIFSLRLSRAFSSHKAVTISSPLSTSSHTSRCWNSNTNTQVQINVLVDSPHIRYSQPRRSQIFGHRAGNQLVVMFQEQPSE